MGLRGVIWENSVKESCMALFPFREKFTKITSLQINEITLRNAYLIHIKVLKSMAYMLLYGRGGM